MVYFWFFFLKLENGDRRKGDSYNLIPYIHELHIFFNQEMTILFILQLFL